MLESMKSSAGGASNSEPIKKCPGVSALKSLTSSVIGSLELRQASICARTVDISSNVSTELLTVRCKCRFTDFIPASHRPPKCGALGGIKCHCMFLFAKLSAITDCVKVDCNNFLNSLLAPMKFDPLSEWIFVGKPRLAANLLKAAMNACVDMSLTASMCTAFVEKHMKRHI